MKDRVPRYPGRVKLTPVAGQSNTYDMTRADRPTETGTPVNKATLLKDDTAAMYGLGPDAVPDDVFKRLAAKDYASTLIIHVNTSDGGSVGNTRVRIRNEQLGADYIKPLDALGNAEFGVLENHTYYVILLDYPSRYYGGAALITAEGGQVQTETITMTTEPDVIGWRMDTSTGAIEYTDGAVNWLPASMGETFDPGSWGDSWLFKNIRPCLLKNGIVQYYLDPNDYSKRSDGTAADITSGDDGDVMVEFPLIYYKFYSETAPDGKKYIGCKFSLAPPDDTYCANAFASEAGVIQSTMYMAAYEGVIYSGKLRSLSGAQSTTGKLIGECNTAATVNGSGYQQQEWCKRTFLQAMFIMMFCGLDSQALLGKGSNNGLITGTMNKKGLCWGSQTRDEGVKFLGIENFWGNKAKYCKGWRASGGIYYYNIHAPYTGSDGNVRSPSLNGGYINKMQPSNAYGMFPIETVDASGQFHDIFYCSTSNYNTYPSTGHYSNSESGIFEISFERDINTSPNITAYLSYTPQGG